MADPGFPVGGGADPLGGGCQPLTRTLSAKTYVKTKEIDPVGGGRAPRRPLDPPMSIITEVHLRPKLSDFI